jgi:cytochrome o ubiquinol oxidase subunit 2
MRQTLLAVLSLCAMAVLLTGCGGDLVLFNSKGQIGIEQRDLIIIATALMLLVVIPAIVMTIWFAWKYRESNKDAEYLPDWSHSTKIEIVVWGVPCLIIAALAYLTYVTSHSLDPYKQIDSNQITKSAQHAGVEPNLNVKPVNIQVIAAPFKWLFIYPEENIATVNEIYVPQNTPVTFTITSDFTMNSFFIPQLGGQVYAMAGMKTQLNLIADKQGVYDGISANYSGHGFSKMRFKAHAVSEGDYAAWIQKVKATNTAVLDQDTVKRLNSFALQGVAEAKQANHHADPNPDPVAYFSTVEPGLFQAVVNKYMVASHGHTEHSQHVQEGATAAHADMAGGH